MAGLLEGLQSLRFFLTENLGLKAGALGIAILMFSLVHGAEDMERNVYVDVVVQPPPDSEEMILVTDMPDRVRVRLKGSRARLNAIRQENLPPVDVRLKSVEEPRFYFEKEAFDLPTGVTVLGVVPPSLAFKWVPRASRELPVELFLDGELSKGLEWAGEPEVFPSRVEVDGPRDVVTSMRTVRAMEIDVSALEEGVTQREIPLVGAPSNTTFGAQSVLVTLRVQAKIVQRTLFGLRVDPEGAVPQSMRPRAVTVRVRGPEHMMKELNPASVLAVVTLAGIGEAVKDTRVPIEIRGLPPEIQVIDIQPREVTVSLGEP